jgi:hypothetical protein
MDADTLARVLHAHPMPWVRPPDIEPMPWERMHPSAQGQAVRHAQVILDDLAARGEFGEWLECEGCHAKTQVRLDAGWHCASCGGSLAAVRAFRRVLTDDERAMSPVDRVASFITRNSFERDGLRLMDIPADPTSLAAAFVQAANGEIEPRSDAERRGSVAGRLPWGVVFGGKRHLVHGSGDGRTLCDVRVPGLAELARETVAADTQPCELCEVATLLPVPKCAGCGETVGDGTLLDYAKRQTAQGRPRPELIPEGMTDDEAAEQGCPACVQARSDERVF